MIHPPHVPGDTVRLLSRTHAVLRGTWESERLDRHRHLCAGTDVLILSMRVTTERGREMSYVLPVGESVPWWAWLTDCRALHAQKTRVSERGDIVFTLEGVE